MSKPRKGDHAVPVAWALAAVLSLLFMITLGQRVPQFILSQIFPNQYAYRISVSFTANGKAFSESGFVRCTMTRTAYPDFLRIDAISEWDFSMRGHGFFIRLPDDRLFIVPPFGVCGPREKADPRWKQFLGISLYERPLGTKPNLIRESGNIVVIDNANDLKTLIDAANITALNRLGIESLKLQITDIDWGSAQESDPNSSMPDNLRSYIKNSPPCSTKYCPGDLTRIVADRYELSAAMRNTEFAQWASTARQDPKRFDFPLPSLNGLPRTIISLRPNWEKSIWEVPLLFAPNEAYSITAAQEWKGDLSTPTICFEKQKCIVSGVRNDRFVDWETGYIYLFGKRKVDIMSSIDPRWQTR